MVYSVLVFSGPETLLSTGESILVSDLILYIVIARTRSTFHVPWPPTPVFALRFTLLLCPSVFSLQTSSKHLPPTNFETERTPWVLGHVGGRRSAGRQGDLSYLLMIAQGARGGRDAGR